MGQEPDDDALAGAREQDDSQTDDANDRERQLRAEAKRYRLELRDAQAKLKERDDREKTELQRLQDEVQAATKRAEVAEMAALKARVAAKYGIPPEDAHRLQGDSPEEVDADGKALAKRWGASPPNGDERPDFSSGVRRPVQRPKTMNDLIRQAAGR